MILGNIKLLENKLLAIYFEKQRTETFIVGKLLGYDNDCIIMILFSPDGKYDGLCLCAISNIYRIELESNYLNTLKKRVKKENIEYAKLCSKKQFFEYAQKNNMILNIKYVKKSTPLFGHLIEYSEKEILIKKILRDGELGNLRKVILEKVSIISLEV